MARIGFETNTVEAAKSTIEGLRKLGITANAVGDGTKVVIDEASMARYNEIIKTRPADLSKACTVGKAPPRPIIEPQPRTIPVTETDIGISMKKPSPFDSPEVSNSIKKPVPTAVASEGLTIKLRNGEEAAEQIAKFAEKGIKATLGHDGKSVILVSEEAAKYLAIAERAALLKTGAKVLGKLATPVTLGMGAYEGYEAYKNKDGHGVAKAVGGTAGTLGGAWAGAAGGAAVGSVAPVVGTVIGGGVAGWWAGSKVVDAAAGDAIHESLNEPTPEERAAEIAKFKAEGERFDALDAKVAKGELQRGISPVALSYGDIVTGYLPKNLTQEQKTLEELVDAIISEGPNKHSYSTPEAFATFCKWAEVDMISIELSNKVFSDKFPKEYRDILIQEAKKCQEAKKTASVDSPVKDVVENSHVTPPTTGAQVSSTARTA